MTCTGEWEIGPKSRRVPENPGEFAVGLINRVDCFLSHS